MFSDYGDKYAMQDNMNEENYRYVSIVINELAAEWQHKVLFFKEPYSINYDSNLSCSDLATSKHMLVSNCLVLL